MYICIYIIYTYNMYTYIHIFVTYIYIYIYKYIYIKLTVSHITHCQQFFLSLTHDTLSVIFPFFYT